MPELQLPDGMRIVYRGTVSSGCEATIVEDPTLPGRRYTWPDGRAWREKLPDEIEAPREPEAAKPRHEPLPGQLTLF
jgi:hypothetical protein